MKKFITLSNFDTLAWGCSYIGDRKYLLGVPSAPTNPDIKYVYVYSTKTGAWTRWPQPWRSGSTVENKLYAIRLTDQQLLQERKALTILDYADDEYEVNIESIDGLTFQLGLNETDLLQVGDTIVQGGRRSLITMVTTSLDQITVDEATNWETDEAIVYRPIEGILRWSEEDAGSPGIFKHWQQLILLFEKTRFQTATVRVATEVSVGFKAVEVAPREQGKWGRFPWGRLPWGRGLGLFQPIRTWFPRDTSRSLWCVVEVRTKQAFTTFSLLGATIDCEVHAVTRFK